MHAYPIQYFQQDDDPGLEGGELYSSVVCSLMSLMMISHATVAAVVFSSFVFICLSVTRPGSCSIPNASARFGFVICTPMGLVFTLRQRFFIMLNFKCNTEPLSLVAKAGYGRKSGG